MKNKIPAWIILTVICIVAAVLLALTNNVTSGIIAANESDTANRVRKELIPEAASFEDAGDGIFIGRDASGAVAGYIAMAPAQGFGGEIEVTVATDTQGTLKGISVGGSNFAETSGLGAKAREPEFQEQFAGKAYPVELTKKGGEIDAISGATITSSAVIKATNAACDKIAGVAGFESAGRTFQNEYALRKDDGLYVTGTAQGFGGPVKVFLTVSDDSRIVKLEIGDNDFNETEYLGERALEPEFAAQFIGKSLPVSIDDIDAISGATITTNAVLEAVNTAFGEIGLIPEKVAPKKTDSGTKVTGKADGFGGPVAVFLTLDDEKKITKIEIGDNDFNETEYLGERALEPEFAAQFIGKTWPITIDDIDAISGATVTTRAVLEAIGQAFASLE